MKKLSFIISFFSSFFLIIFVVFTLVLFNTSSFASKKEIEKNLLNTDLKFVIGKIRNSGSTENQTKISKAINDIYSISREYGVSEDVIDDILDSKVTKEVLSMPLGNLTDYVINGKDSKVLSSEDVYNLISSNIDTLFDKVDYELSDAQKEKFLSRVKLEIPDVISAIPTVSLLTEFKYGDKIKVIQFVFGKTFKAVLIGGIILFSILIIAFQKKRSLLYLGISLLSASLLTIGFSFFIPDLILKFISIWEVSMFISSFSGILCMKIIVGSLALAFLSVIILLINGVINRRGNMSSI